MPERCHRILIVDDNYANLRILEANFRDEGYEVLTARSAEEAQAVLMDNRQGIHQGLHQGIDLVLSDIQMPGQTGFDLVRWAKASGLAEIPILLITSQLPEPENRVFGLSLGAVDYVERSLDPKELELRVAHAISHFTQLRSLRASLENSENLALVGRLLAASNHEVKNLAQVIKTTAQIVSQHFGRVVPAGDEVTGKALTALQQSANLLAEVSRAMNNMIGNEAPAIQALDLGATVEFVLSMIRPMLKNTYVEVAIAQDDPIWVGASATHLKQILINLLLNAREAVKEAALTDGGHIEVHLEMTDAEASVVVCDNGVGFSQAETRTEFPAFATTKQLRGGKGLGLWLADRFAQGMGGRLALVSAGPGRGVEAKLTLTRVSKPAKTFTLEDFFEADERF